MLNKNRKYTSNKRFDAFALCNQKKNNQNHTLARDKLWWANALVAHSAWCENHPLPLCTNDDNNKIKIKQKRSSSSSFTSSLIVIGYKPLKFTLLIIYFHLGTTQRLTFPTLSFSLRPKWLSMKVINALNRSVLGKITVSYTRLADVHNTRHSMLPPEDDQMNNKWNLNFRKFFLEWNFIYLQHNRSIEWEPFGLKYSLHIV